MTATTTGVRDKTTFQFADMRQGAVAGKAYAQVTAQFIKQFAPLCPQSKTASGATGSAVFDTLVSTLLNELVSNEEVPRTSESLEGFVKGLEKRKNDLLEADRKMDKARTKKWTGANAAAAAKYLDDDSDSDVDALGQQKKALTEEEKAELERQWIEQCRLEEMREEEAWRNEEELQQRARHIDASSLLEDVEKGKVEVINPGAFDQLKSKGGKGKGGKNNNKNNNNNVSQEEINMLVEAMDTVRKEKEILKDMIALSGMELVEALATLQAEVGKMEEEAKAKGVPAEPRNAGKMNKGQVTDLENRLAKQRTETNALGLQLKGGEVPEVGIAVVEAAKKKAVLYVSLLRVE